MVLKVDDALQMQLNTFAEQCRKSVASDTCIVVVSSPNDDHSGGVTAAGISGRDPFADPNEFLAAVSLDLLRAGQQILNSAAPGLFKVIVRTKTADIEITLGDSMAFLLNDAGGLDPSDQAMLTDYQQRQTPK